MARLPQRLSQEKHRVIAKALACIERDLGTVLRLALPAYGKSTLGLRKLPALLEWDSPWRLARFFLEDCWAREGHGEPCPYNVDTALSYSEAETLEQLQRLQADFQQYRRRVAEHIATEAQRIVAQKQSAATALHSHQSLPGISADRDVDSWT